jgi:hypothetical protein
LLKFEQSQLGVKYISYGEEILLLIRILETMNLPFKCSFCEIEFLEFENYKVHLSSHIPSQTQPPGDRIPLSVTREQLKCSLCDFEWLQFKTEDDVFLSYYNLKQICSACITERETRRCIIEQYRGYFRACRELWDVRHKSLYVKSYTIDRHCCLCTPHRKKILKRDCHDKRILPLHYSLAVYPKHRICQSCFNFHMDKKSLLQNCICGYFWCVGDILTLK